MVSFSAYNQLSKSWEKYSSIFIETITKELDLYAPLLRERQKVIEKKSKEHFNIFSAISDVYKRENYNSDILKLILDPNTEDMGDSIYLKHFLLFIGLNEDDIERYFGNFESVEVLREKHRIDILIRNKKYAVIIESKINETIDQPNQLVRYYKRISEDDKLTVLKIVYLTLIPQKKPCFDYDSEHKTDGITKETFEEYVKTIKKNLFCISAISDKNEDKGKTLKDYLEICINQATTDLGKVLISQYSKLLEKTGGDILMLIPEKKLIQEIYSSKERINNATDFAKVWENKNEILKEIFIDKFKEIHNDWSLEAESTERFYKEIIIDKLYLYYEPLSWKQIGFWGYKLNKQKRSLLKNVLTNLKHTGLKVEGEIGEDDDGFIFVNFIYDNEPIDEFFPKTMEALEELLKASKEIKF